ncbi:hypothetical protein CsSME_00033812 [Camellia sinensis var. sinensis]
MNVELHNIWEFEVMPKGCTEYVGKYMNSIQYKVDSERAVDNLKRDGRDARIFNIHDTLLGEKLNMSSLEEWQSKAKAPVLEHTLKLFNDLKGRGMHIILVSPRREQLRTATIDNLVDVGFHGWTSLIQRKQLIEQGYHIWGIVGDQWSSIEGLPTAKRTFTLPNLMYYVS